MNNLTLNKPVVIGYPVAFTPHRLNAKISLIRKHKLCDRGKEELIFFLSTSEKGLHIFLLESM